MRMRRRDGSAFVAVILLLLGLLALVSPGLEFSRVDAPSTALVKPIALVPLIDVPAPPPELQDPEPIPAPPPVRTPAVRPTQKTPTVVIEDEIPAAPADLVAEPGAQGEVVLAWKRPTGAGDQVAYEVRRGQEVVHEGNEETFTEHGLRPATEHCWEVRALSARDRRPSSPARTCAVPRDVTPPTVPASFVAAPRRDGGVVLEWIESADDVGPVSYDVFERARRLAHLAATSWTHSRLQPGTEHCYYVRAVDDAGNRSAFSEQRCVTIPDPPPAQPERAAVAPAPARLPSAASEVTIAPLPLERVMLTWRPIDGEVVYRIYTSSGKVIGLTAGTTFVLPRTAAEQCYQIKAIYEDDRVSRLSRTACVSGTGTSAMRAGS